MGKIASGFPYEVAKHRQYLWSNISLNIIGMLLPISYGLKSLQQ